MTTYEQRAAQLGISPDAGQTVVTASNVDHLQRILRINDNPADQQANHEAIFRGVTEDEEVGMGETVQRAVVSFVHGDVQLSDEVRGAIGQVFPLNLPTVSRADMTVNSEWDLTGIQPDGMVIINLGTLVLEQGGYIVIRGRPLQFMVDTLIRRGTPGAAGMYDFNILGDTWAAGAAGNSPGAPGQAQSGDPGECSSAGVAGRSGTPGHTGVEGTEGGRGDPGQDGTPSQAAFITINQAVTLDPSAGQYLTVGTRSGAGGPGGPGGTGARGGQGGNGGSGATCGCTGNAGASGGQGGRGGHGGPGGAGGNGVDAVANITVKVPITDLGKIKDFPSDAPPGPGGSGGAPGAGGAGGGAGGGGKNNSGGSPGSQGASGQIGANGPAGVKTGKPALVSVLPL